MNGPCCATILRLVAERAEAEAKVESDRTTRAAAGDSEYEKTRRNLIEKLRNLESEAVAADAQRRRAIVDAALDGERKAKSEFAAASRKLATLFDSARDVAKSEYNQAKNDAASSFDSGQKKAAKEHAAKIKPIEDCAGMAEGYRQRLAVLAADYRKFKLNPNAPEPTRESYDRYSDPSDELFTRLARMEPPLKLIESLIIPKAMKGGREAWVFVFVIVPLVGIAFALGSDENMVTMIGAAAVVGRGARVFIAHLAYQALAIAARKSLLAAHALAGRRRCLDITLPRPARRGT